MALFFNIFSNIFDRMAETVTNQIIHVPVSFFNFRPTPAFLGSGTWPIIGPGEYADLLALR